MRLLFVGKCAAQAAAIGNAATKSAVSCEYVDTAFEALGVVRSFAFEAIIIGQLGSDHAARELVARFRGAGISLPLLVIVSTAETAPKVKVLDAGADDVVNESVHSDEVLARLRALVRRSKGFASPFLRLGPLELGQITRQAKVCGQRLTLSPKEFALLELLLLNKGTPMKKEILMDYLYGGLDEPELKIVDVMICRLRKKLAAVGLFSLIETVWGAGYVVHDVPDMLSEDAIQPTAA